jgi:hypothetical protein
MKHRRSERRRRRRAPRDASPISLSRLPVSVDPWILFAPLAFLVGVPPR